MNLIRRVRIISALLVAVVYLSACSTLPNKTAVSLPKKAEQLSHWSASGKILIVSNNEKNSANFYWRQQDKNYTFILSTFLGIDVFSLTFQNGLATMKVDGKTYTDTNAERLLSRLTQQQIPVQKMSQWLLGNKSSSIKSAYFDELGLLTSFFVNVPASPIKPALKMPLTKKMERWDVSYKQRKLVYHYQLPTSINIKSPSTRIKLAISNWQIQG